MLKRVSIQNFKSLKDITLDLQKVNLLIGPNNSGKTNFLKALEFMATRKSNVNVEVPDNVIFRVESDQFKVLGDYSDIRNDRYISMYLVNDNPTSRGYYDHNLLHSKSKNRTIQSGERRKYYVIDAIMTGEKLHSFNVEAKDPSPDSGNFRQLIHLILNNLRIYKPDPNKLDKPAPVGRGEDLVAADASNMIAFFDRIRDEYPASFAQIKADLATCVPEFTEINFQNVESTEELVKQFGDKTFKRIGLTDGRQKTIYWADELSEGTLYFIALLCIINQPNPPKLLLLEEPEKGIHPRRIFEVIQFILRLVEEKDIQVIMTTHSPVVLDMFADMPESVFIFDKDEEGATHVKNLQRDVIEPDTEKSKEFGMEPPHYTDALGDAWTVGFLGGVPK